MTKGSWYFHEDSVNDCRRLWAGRSGAHEWRTADPSAPPDFLLRVAASVSCVCFSLERTTSVVAGESGEVRKSGYARDDKKERVVARKGRLLEERVVAEPRSSHPL